MESDQKKFYKFNVNDMKTMEYCAEDRFTVLLELWVQQKVRIKEKQIKILLIRLYTSTNTYSPVFLQIRVSCWIYIQHELYLLLTLDLVT